MGAPLKRTNTLSVSFGFAEYVPLHVCKTFQVYLDGHLTQTDNGVASSQTLPTAQPILIAGKDYSTDNSPYLGSTIDELKIYTRILNGQEIQNLGR